jgi:hypothetical protein
MTINISPPATDVSAALLTLTNLAGAGSITLKPSGDTDDYFTFATASNIPTIYGTGSYLRIGDAGSANTLSSEDDLLVSGRAECLGPLNVSDGKYLDAGSYSGGSLVIGNSADGKIFFTTEDANANELWLCPATGSGNNVPAIVISTAPNTLVTNIGLFDGITQPLEVVLEKGGQLHTATDGIANAGGATAILNHVGGFTNAVVGDIVRITAGTNCTVGWYWITTVTSADVVILDRNYTSGDTTNVTFVTFHNFPMIGADGVCLKCFDGAPGDANVEIDRDGWLQLDVSQANGRLYWRANNAWHYVDATA